MIDHHSTNGAGADKPAPDRGLRSGSGVTPLRCVVWWPAEGAINPTLESALRRNAFIPTHARSRFAVTAQIARAVAPSPDGKMHAALVLVEPDRLEGIGEVLLAVERRWPGVVVRVFTQIPKPGLRPLTQNERERLDHRAPLGVVLGPNGHNLAMPMPTPEQYRMRLVGVANYPDQASVQSLLTPAPIREDSTLPQEPERARSGKVVSEEELDMLLAESRNGRQDVGDREAR